MGMVYSIVNQKGGVGKTTSSVNLGACLAVAKKKVLLIDLDPQGNASGGLGLDKALYEEKNIYQGLIGAVPFSEIIYPTELPYLDICPADNNLTGAEIELVSILSREAKLKNSLIESGIKKKYDYIIIDCPPGLGLLTINALNASDRYIVPMQTEYFAMEGLSQLVNTVRLVKKSLNPKLELEGVLLTMFDGRNNLHKQVTQEIRNHFGEKVFETVIPRNVKLSECPSFGKPVVLYDAESRGSEAYISLSKEVIKRNLAGSGEKEKAKENVRASKKDRLSLKNENHELSSEVATMDLIINRSSKKREEK